MTLYRFIQSMALPLRGAIKWYLKSPRSYSLHGVKVTILPGVFHPGLFHSTKFLLNYILDQDLANRKFLELGCGSGIISIHAARKKAIVTASDISEVAIECTKLNAQQNEVNFQICQSDLFTSLSPGAFDYISINPPYYPSDPASQHDYAWYCGAHHEYFKKLFTQLSHHVHQESKVVMILSDVCDTRTIFQIAQEQGWEFEKVRERKILVDGKNTIYHVRLKSLQHADV